MARVKGFAIIGDNGRICIGGDGQFAAFVDDEDAVEIAEFTGEKHPKILPVEIHIGMDKSLQKEESMARVKESELLPSGLRKGMKRLSRIISTQTLERQHLTHTQIESLRRILADLESSAAMYEE